MASIQDRLARTEWDPQPDDTLVGTIVKIGEDHFVARDDGRTMFYPVLVIRAEDGVEHIVRCSRGGLLKPMLAHRPAVGAVVGIRYVGSVAASDGGKDAHRYVVEFEDDEGATPDWDRIADSQQRDKPVDSAYSGTGEPGF